MLKDDVIENVKSSEDIPNIDWCTFIWDYIKESKEKWNDATYENWYYGPHVTFTLIYLHYTKFDEMDVPRKYPAIKNWTYDLLEERQEKEMARDAIGMVMVIEEDEENEENENQKIKQEIYERIQDNFDRVLREKNELESIIKASMEMYEGDATIGRFVVRFNTEFQIGIKTDEFGRLVDDKAGPSRKDGDESGTEDNREESGSDNDEGGDDGRNDNGGEDMEQMNEGENWNDENQYTGAENLKDAEKEAAEKAQAEKEATEKAEKEAAEKEAAEKEAAEKAQAKKEAAEKVRLFEKALKEAAAKEAAEKALKEAAEKEAVAKAQAEKDAATKALEEEKEAAKKKQIAEANAKKQKEAAERKKQEEIEKIEKEQEKTHKEAEKKRKAAAKELNEKRAKEKAEKEAAKKAKITEYESPSVQEKPFKTGKEIAEESIMNEEKQGKRIVKPSIYLQSPYNNKMSNVTEPLTKDETLLAHSLLSMEGDILDEMFNDGIGTIIPRITMQSISPGIEIDSQIIDALATVLNEQERMKLRKEKRRYYLPVGATRPQIEKNQKNVAAQVEVLKNIIEKDKTSYRLRDMKLVFFPIIAHGHYYVIVFDLEKGHALILDNSISDATYEGKYKEIFDFVREVFVQYLFMTDHPSLTLVTKDVPPKIPKMKWKTRKNKIDCGLYMMMHMEMFEGEIGLKWKTNILDESNRNYQNMIKTMRMRYAAKILLHDVNKNRENVSQMAMKFGEEHSDPEKQKKMVEEAIKKKAAEDK